MYAVAYVKAGGNGASAKLVPQKAKLGFGGRGGYGGGGGGASGIAIGCQYGNSANVASLNVYNKEKPGVGGDGAEGGEGGDGYIILYYRRPRAKKADGPIVTSDQKWLLDRLGRRFVV